MIISIFVHCNTSKLQALKLCFVLFAPFCGHINDGLSELHQLCGKGGDDALDKTGAATGYNPAILEKFVPNLF